VAAEGKREPGAEKAFGPAEIDAAALRYLDRFDATQRKLGDYLLRLARRRGADAAVVRPLIEELIERYRGSGLIDDRRFARVRAQALSARGASRRLIALKLMQAGVARETVDEVLSEQALPTRELDAATVYVKRKRLGRFRADAALAPTNGLSAEELEMRRKDLARLARQGFDWDTATRALGLGSDEDF